LAETMNGKVPAGQRSEVSSKVISQIILEVQIQTAQKVNDASLFLLVLCTR